ncbi:hypothetical protein ON010_g1956 [Phytophthora cinnamomi]|nr:hypothetical protein ON010_g1956 [Phytophthora cinnamomi]
MSALGSGAIAAIALAFVDAKRRRSLALRAALRALERASHVRVRDEASDAAARVLQVHCTDRPRGVGNVAARAAGEPRRTGQCSYPSKAAGPEAGNPEGLPIADGYCSVQTCARKRRLVCGGVGAVLQTCFPEDISALLVTLHRAGGGHSLQALPAHPIPNPDALHIECDEVKLLPRVLRVAVSVPRVRASPHELALYVLPRALDSLAMILHDRGICSGFKYGEIALFSASMSVMMYCYEHEKESMSPFLYSTMKRFLQTSTDKKQLYAASLEKKERRRSQSLVQPPAIS